jgi:hypothetical protein
MARLELPHGVSGGIIPLAIWGPGERTIFGERLLNLGDAFGSWRFLPRLPPFGMFAGLL